jgi:uncharacterized protein (DUF302 family)
MNNLLKLVNACLLGLTLLSGASYAATSPSAAKATEKILPNIYKIPLAKGVSMDDAVDSMKLRANALNIKLVAELPLSKQVEAMTGNKERRMTIFQFCDALTAKELVNLDMDFAIFLPCRIALIEDKTGQAWLIMMDMNVNQLSKAAQMNKALTDKITTVRNGLIEIMNAGAKGDL